MGFIAKSYSVEQTTPLMTDKYHFTTALGYWLEGRGDARGVFYMFGRKEAFGAGYAVAAGLEGVIDIVQRWQKHGFTEEDLAFLRVQKTPSGQQQFPDAFLEFLTSLTFKLKIDAAPEGALFFPQEPILRVEGNLIEAKLLEPIALCLMNGHSAYASHAAQMHDVLNKELPNGAPKGQASVQGLRRGPALGAALESSRSLGLGGYSSSSTGTAAKDYGQAFTGTMDHAWVMTHEAELGDIPLEKIFEMEDEALHTALTKDAFRSFAYAHPEAGVLLVDTYDAKAGLDKAITVIQELRTLGKGQHYGVRFDSGDITAYSKIALRRFAEAGFIDGLEYHPEMRDDELLKQAAQCSVFCVAADGIDQFTAQDMREHGAYLNLWGIGTAGSHVPPMGLVYKASMLEDEPVMKVAAHAPIKSSNPGKINARRYYDAMGKLAYSVLFDEDGENKPSLPFYYVHDFSVQQGATTSKYKDLLIAVFDSEGQLIYDTPTTKESFEGSGTQVTNVSAIASNIYEELDTLPSALRNIKRPKDEQMKEHLLNRYQDAKKAGLKSVSVDIGELELLEQQSEQHLAIYVDAKLYEKRKAIEAKHKTTTKGVGKYHERYQSA